MNNSTDLKNIVGEIKPGDVVTIRFFGKITEESANQFNNEFDYLESYVKPKLIRVLINSEGGSVLHGMSTYSIIQNSTLPTECVIEGMAASMASIIWAAGTRSLMRDYSILMIHNPFLPDDEDNKGNDLVQAFTKQIKTIYRKRFGLKKDHIEAIMAGAAGKDGTFFDAYSAVKAGIISSENIIHTSKQLCEKVRSELPGLENATDIQHLMTRICAEADMLTPENKHFFPNIPNLKQIQNSNQMTEANNNEYSAVAATLGFKDKFEVKDVMSRISELLSVEAKLTDTANQLKDAQTIIAGKDATIQNLQKDNGELTSSLNEYKTKEEESKREKTEHLVESAITDGKIDKASKAQWIEMANANFSLAETTLHSIPTPDKISKEIASDPANVQVAVKGTKTEEDQLAERVNSVVGSNFEFKKIG